LRTTYLLLFVSLSCVINIQAQARNTTEDYWKLTNRQTILWDLNTEEKLPHKDNIEMSGKKISAIIYYELDKEKNLRIEKDLIFPQLRTYNKSNEPDWKKYRAYFRKKISQDISPTLFYNNKIIVPTKIDSVEIGGMITFYYQAVEGLKVTKTIYPSMEDRLLVEEWELENTNLSVSEISISNVSYRQPEKGYKGDYTFIVLSDAKEELLLKKNERYTFPIYYGATLNEEESSSFKLHNAKQSRLDYLKICSEQLVLETPNDTINRLFHFSKIRAAESIFESSMGLIHSPGGGNYYVGIWANDQIEYSGPFFPYLGYEKANTAAYNAYKVFSANIPRDGGHIPYAFEVDGNFPMTHLDRGDAAMITYGLSQYLLASGNRDQAKELWPLLEWSIEYCEKKKNEQGAVMSESDEMEGRIETGDANLSTSSLYYGGLSQAIHIAKALNMPGKAELYQIRAIEMDSVIENYFGANIEGFDTYKYFEENTKLRHWICLPLVMGIAERKDQTLSALFDKLWTKNGILVEYDPTSDIDAATFWDRATLYALRGAMKIGEIELAYSKLNAYSKKRLLGDRVPYAVEAYPENEMKHLSAESALYCRVIIEGLLGIEPIGFAQAKIKPILPNDWDDLELRQIYICGVPVDITVSREGSEGLLLTVQSADKTLFDKIVYFGESIVLNFEE